jgi:hypothetical protein
MERIAQQFRSPRPDRRQIDSLTCALERETHLLDQLYIHMREERCWMYGLPRGCPQSRDELLPFYFR